MRKREAWLGHGKQRQNSCAQPSEEKVAKRLRRAYARATDYKHTKDEFGTVRLVDPSQDQLNRAGVRSIL